MFWGRLGDEKLDVCDGGLPGPGEVETLRRKDEHGDAVGGVGG